MRWITDPAEVIGNPNCYCDPILQPDDLMLQARPIMPMGATSVMAISAYSVDGSLIADFTSSFTWNYGIDGNANPFVNLKMTQFPGALCETCFFLLVKITTGGVTIFASYTDLYCIKNCCAIPRGTVINVDGVPVTVGDPTIVGNGAGAGADVLVDECGYPYLRLEGVFNCYDAFTGQWSSTGKNAGGPTAFTFRNTVVMRATVRDLAAVVARTVSEFCRVQKVTYTEQVELQSFDSFPAWKKSEIEKLLCAPKITIDGTEYTYAASEDAFSRIYSTVVNTPFKFKIKLGKCEKRQIFGCNDCDEQPISFFPLRRSGNTYYDENGRLIATDLDGLKNYFTGLPGVISVSEGDLTDVNGPAYALVQIETYNNTNLPSFIYLDSAIRVNRVYRKDSTDGDVNDIFGYSRTCVPPVIGTITFVTYGCPDPVLGTITFELPEQVTGTIDAAGAWTKLSGDLTQYGGDTVVFSLSVFNESVTLADPESDIITYANEVIGQVVEIANWPTSPRYLTHAEISALPVGATVIINIDGSVTYTGDSTGHHDTHPQIDLPELTYPI